MDIAYEINRLVQEDSKNMDDYGQTNRVNDGKNHSFERAREDSNLQPSDSKSATLSN